MALLGSYVTLGRSGLRVSPLALGAMTFDDGSWGSAQEESFAIIDRYLEVGGNFIDTANQYNGGASEETLGAYFAGRPGVRDRVVLGTKFGGTMDSPNPNAGGAGRKAVLAQLDASLRRLRTDYVDLYWMHMWDRHTPLEETLSTLNDLVHAGKVRAIGLSNTPAWWVAQAATTARLRGWDVLERIAQDLGTKVAAVALAWVRQQEPVTSVLVGARTLDQLDNNLASAAVTLDPSQLAELSALTTPELNYPHAFTEGVGIGFLQGDATVNGVTSVAFRRS
ncbi:aryl-alcohol dehydrogenase-like predicted oxidoreductase [Kitasatospora sp. MAA4]|uniref:aldo/keto reductase n=1 Tax=Kitasatospora sp. MAA4 TaxID=3035093 RepID=UPI00247727CF|nr:aldo/keto reductase [Kitasatospora sp. MAA4]MDH6130815.1 aryl-alcohol dehydrogenase-like predicted oxidoreductase [Kitasatospora sp. MAA4]